MGSLDQDVPPFRYISSRQPIRPPPGDQVPSMDHRVEFFPPYERSFLEVRGLLVEVIQSVDALTRRVDSLTERFDAHYQTGMFPLVA